MFLIVLRYKEHEAAQVWNSLRLIERASGCIGRLRLIERASGGIGRLLI